MKPKIFILFTIFVLVLLALLLTGCTRKPTQVIYEANVCVNCHNDNTFIKAIIAQWGASVHATGGNFERNANTCAPCHTSEGFVEVVATGADTTVSAIENPSAIGCRTCHHPHTTYDFTLRTTAPVRIKISGATFNRGKGNICANCHQPRIPVPLPVVGGDSITITSSRWGPHYGSQSAILIGTGGYETPGSTPYENSEHTTEITNGCLTCHMANPYGIQAGGHTMNLVYEYHGSEVDLTTGCNRQECHDGELDNFDYNGVQTEIAGLLDQLRSLLVSEGILDNSTGSAVTGKWSSIQAGALLNYLLLEADRSLGVHNANYCRALLQNSIDALQGPPLSSK